MIVLADNDLILKLSQCDLLDSLGDLLHVPAEHIFVTAEARFQLLKKNREKGIASCGNEETYDRLAAFLARTEVLPVVTNTDLLARLATIPGIDAGEQQLFAAACELPAPLLLTDDKISLGALLKHADDARPVVQALYDRVVTFASILLLAQAQMGFPLVKQKLLGNPRPDGMLRLVLRDDMTSESLTECLCSYARPVSVFLAFRDRLPDLAVRE